MILKQVLTLSELHIRHTQTNLGELKIVLTQHSLAFANRVVHELVIRPLIQESYSWVHTCLPEVQYVSFVWLFALILLLWCVLVRFPFSYDSVFQLCFRYDFLG